MLCTSKKKKNVPAFRFNSASDKGEGSFRAVAICVPFGVPRVEVNSSSVGGQ